MDWIYTKKDMFGLKTRQLGLTFAENHPLNVVEKHDEKSTEKAATNKNEKPKLVVTSFEGLDPLSAALTSANAYSPYVERKHSKSEFLDYDFQDWKIHKSKILNVFNTNERLSLKSSFFQDKTGATISVLPQKVKNRLEQLDDFEEGVVHEMSNLTQSEYTGRIEELKNTLTESWAQDEKVKALKIAIQCAKQLGATNVIHFYPSKFVLISDILDSFGELVYKRLKNMSDTRTNEPQQVIETTRNWFYKISSIRELLPRFFIETSVLRIYQFLIEKKDFEREIVAIFGRLSHVIRGVGDPLVASYCRVYLTRTAIKLFPEKKEIFIDNIREVFGFVNHLNSISVQQNLNQQSVDYRTYYTLYTPALDWILNCALYKADSTVLDSVLSMFKNLSRHSIQNGCSALVLNSLTSSFPPMFVLNHLDEFMDFIKNIVMDILVDDGQQTVSTSVYPKHVLFRNVGVSLCQLDQLLEFEESQKPKLLEELYEISSKLKARDEYIACVEPWAEIVARCYDLSDLNALLGQIITKMATNRDFEMHSSQLFSTLSKTVRHASSRFEKLTFFTMSNLLPYLDLFHKEDVKADAAKLLLETMNQRLNERNVRIDGSADLMLLNCGTFLCKTVHDAVNAFSIDDEKRQCSSLIVDFIRQITFGRDFEAQLNFYVEARANYSNLDSVMNFVVVQVNSLAMETHHIVRGNHTKKTISFVASCLAYSFITIPSIEDVIVRLQLYLHSGQVALMNACLPQTDSFFKSAISLCRQLPTHHEGTDGMLHSNDRFLYEFVSQTLSTLLVVPDNPEYGHLYLFKGLYNVLKEYRFDNLLNYKFLIWSNMIRYLANCTLEEYPYHVYKVDSNDTLYGQNPEFLKEILTYTEVIFQELVDNMRVIPLDDVRRTLNNAISIIELIVQVERATEMSHVIDQLWRLIVRIETESRPQEWFQARKKKTIKACRKIFEISV